MKRVQEKVKDLVEVRSYKVLQDFISDPSQTLSAYHFTDATSDMMALWLDKIADVNLQSGASKALAGYRGVGKSHFLATLGAVVSHPELRSRITDGHVAASAQRLKRRRHLVANVRRGTHPTLIEEIKEAIAKTFEISPIELTNSINDLLEFAASKSDDLPFILLIDTAFDRSTRVSRDDGILLGEIAELAKKLNVFVGVALDDDIAGADGVNAAIAMNYTIDYLDQEHLYRIVETHLFPKYRPTQHLLHEIYMGFREVMPSFRWSEQRFTSLYPLHPVILEASPFIRLYAPDFAMLSFASEAGAKVLGRPANSLVALDEVFDRVESSLRKAEDLKEAFATYDTLNTEVISSIPVMQRLQAKLVLKALLLLSLDGDGTTAGEIGAAMLIYNEDNPQSSSKSVEDLLETFVSIYPDAVRRVAEEGREIRFGLRVSGKDNLNSVLAESAKTVSPKAIEKILRRFAREKYSDWTLPAESDSLQSDTTECQINWRGGFRRGRVIWDWQNKQATEVSAEAERVSEFIDWEVIIADERHRNSVNRVNSEIPTVLWQTATLKPEEEETLLRYYVLLTDTSLRGTFGEQVRAAGHTHQTAVEQIWRRIFIEEGKLIIDGFQHPFTDTAKALSNLSEMLSQMLMPLFELRYQQHPYFERNLGMNEVSQIVTEHFSGAKQNMPDVQNLAREFALPLGLVIRHGNFYVLENEERLSLHPFAQEVMNLVNKAGSETISLKTVYQTLKREPYGLVREAQHLVLAALVAQRRIEFIASKGDRINRRSLDLKIIWDDIIGISSPSAQVYGSEELTNWAKILTGIDTLRTIDNSEDILIIREALTNWLNDWRSAGILERFEKLPDDVLNTKIWKLSTHAKKTFGAVELAVEAILQKAISLEEGLQRVADAFSDSEEEFFTCTKNLVTLEDFINGLGIRKKVWEYLAVCEATKDENIEELREKLLQIVKELSKNPSEFLNNQLESLWQSFYARFSEHFAIKHDTVMKSHQLQEKFDEIMRSDEWWEFENLSNLFIFQKNHWRKAQKLFRQFRELDCSFDVREMLKTHPFCACSFRLSQVAKWEKLTNSLSETIEDGRVSYRKTLVTMTKILIPLLQNFAQNEQPGEFTEAACSLCEIFESGESIRLLTTAELIILSKMIQALPASPLLEINIPFEKGFLSREDLRFQMTEWIDELPGEPCLLKF